MNRSPLILNRLKQLVIRRSKAWRIERGKKNFSKFNCFIEILYKIRKKSWKFFFWKIHFFCGNEPIFRFCYQKLVYNLDQFLPISNNLQLHHPRKYRKSPILEEAIAAPPIMTSSYDQNMIWYREKSLLEFQCSLGIRIIIFSQFLVAEKIAPTQPPFLGCNDHIANQRNPWLLKLILSIRGRFL